jgi:small subunit ribosomal protein S15
MAEEQIKKTDWTKIKPAELEKIVVELYKKGETTAKIGLVLRDKYGIPKAKALGKRISEILTDAKMELKSDKEPVQRRIDILNKHLEKNKYDQPAKKKLIKELWALKRA